MSRNSLTERVEKGQRDRAAMLRKFGTIPHSVLRLSRGPLSASMFNMLAERATGRVRGADSLAREQAFTTEAGKATARERRERGLFGGVKEYADANDRETVSVMAAELVDFFARYYSRAGATYIDPFAGQGIQLQVAHRLGMHYIGVDLCAEYVRYIERVISKLTPADGQVLRIIEADSRYPVDVPDGCGDFTFTSPPYWDVEFYGPEAGQLGTGQGYGAFLDGLREVAEAWRPKYRSGAYVVVNVNDLRRDGRFIPYHADVIRLYMQAGYVPHDVWIVEGLIAGLPKAFAVSFNMKRIAPKVHEYALCFRVP